MKRGVQVLWLVLCAAILVLIVSCVVAIGTTARAFQWHSPTNTAPTIRAADRRSLEESSLICHIVIELVSTGGKSLPLQQQPTTEPDFHYQCFPVLNHRISDFSYMIELPLDFVNENYNQIVTGTLFASIRGGEIVNGTVVYSPSSFGNEISITLAPKSFLTRRSSSKSKSSRLSGIERRTVLVLRITALDTTNVYTASQLYNYMFNNTRPFSQPTMRSQYAKLSFGKLYFVPSPLGNSSIGGSGTTTGNSSSISSGILEVAVAINATGSTSMDLRDAAIAVVQNYYGVESITDLADHVILCLPPGTGDWAAASPVQSWRIVVNNQWCGSLSALMHEMGHNLGLLHSNIGSYAYSDYTSYMAAGYVDPHRPAKSFNGANHWQLGWYRDRRITIDPATSAQSGKPITLVAFVDYAKGNKKYPVLIQVGNDTYLQYNRAKGINYQAEQCVDQVTIVQQLSNGTNLLGCIDPSSPSFTISNFTGSGRNVVIYACNRGSGNAIYPDWISITIGYEQNNSCLTPSLHPTTTSPTKRPSSAALTPITTNTKQTSTPILKPSQPTAPSSIRPNPPTPTKQATPPPTTIAPALVPAAFAPMKPTPGPAQSSAAPVKPYVPTLIKPTTGLAQPSAAPAKPSAPTLPYKSPVSVPSSRPTLVPVKPTNNTPLPTAKPKPSLKKQPTSLPVKTTLTPVRSPPNATIQPAAPSVPSTTGKPTTVSVDSTTAKLFPQTSLSSLATTTTTMPVSSNNYLTCSDTTVATMYVNGIGNEHCVWLAARASLQTELCLQPVVQTLCPKTCQVCTASCADSLMGTFVDHTNMTRNCLWLSLRPDLSATLCLLHPNVAALCPATCKVCYGA